MLDKYPYELEGNVSKYFSGINVALLLSQEVSCNAGQICEILLSPGCDGKQCQKYIGRCRSMSSTFIKLSPHVLQRWLQAMKLSNSLDE